MILRYGMQRGKELKLLKLLKIIKINKMIVKLLNKKRINNFLIICREA
jgi:hypothetical protein